MIGTTNTPGISGMTFKGSTSTADGRKGLVPTPVAGDENKVLFGDGTWKSIGGANVIKDILWEGQAYTYQQVLNLTHNYTDYDYVICSIGKSENNVFLTHVQATDTGSKVRTSGLLPVVSSDFKTGVTLTFDGATVTISDYLNVGASADDMKLVRIEGIKFVNPNVYSTTEQRIGTWIDGKPLYQVTITGTTPSTAGEAGGISLVDLGATYNVKQVVDISGYVLSNAGSCWAINTGLDYTASVRMSSVKELFVQATSESLSLSIFVTIKYTKTTD